MTAAKLINNQSQSFINPDLLDKLPSMSINEVDALEFGVIQVDDRGMVRIYNNYQAELDNFPKQLAQGKNYFTQIMPCSCNRLFYERFKMGISLNNLDYVMPYTLTYRIKPTSVKIHLYRDLNTKTNWVLVRKQ